MTMIRHLIMKAKHRASVRYTCFLHLLLSQHQSKTYVLGDKRINICQMTAKQLTQGGDKTKVLPTPPSSKRNVLVPLALDVLLPFSYCMGRQDLNNLSLTSFTFFSFHTPIQTPSSMWILCLLFFESLTVPSYKVCYRQIFT